MGGLLGVGPRPCGDFNDARPGFCDPPGESLQFLVRGGETMAVLTEEEGCSGDPRALVAVHEGMIVDQGVHQGGRFGEEVWVEVAAAEGCPGAGHC
jgi:hypothetical protein